MGFGVTKKVSERNKRSNILLPWKVNWRDDIGLEKPGYFVVVHDLEALWKTSDNPADNGDLLIHFVKGQPKAPICNHLYFDEGDKNSKCDFCEMPGFNGEGDNNPFVVKPLLVVCLNLIGEKKQSKDGKKEYDVNPLKILEIRYKKNFANIEEYHQEGALSVFDRPSSILTMRQTAREDGKPGKFSEPVFCDDVQIKKLSKQFKTDIEKACPKIWEQFNPAGRSPEELEDLKAEIRGLIFEQYGNIKKDHKLFTDEVRVIWPETKEEEVIEASDGEDDTEVEGDEFGVDE